MGEFAFQTLRESITSAIRSKILTGELQPGTKLAEQRLAEEFGSSRAPIREALRQLEQEGMVEYSRNVGCSVRRVKPEDAYEIYLLRANLEMTALRYFDCKFPEEDLRTCAAFWRRCAMSGRGIFRRSWRTTTASMRSSCSGQGCPDC